MSSERTVGDGSVRSAPSSALCTAQLWSTICRPKFVGVRGLGCRHVGAPVPRIAPPRDRGATGAVRVSSTIARGSEQEYAL